jgi:hypothetical protein
VKQRKTDDQIAIMLKNKLAELIEGTSDAATVVAITNAFAKLRSVELKADEGEWASGLDTDLQQPQPLSEVRR